MIKRLNKVNSIIIILVLILNLLFPIISIASDEIVTITFQDQNLYNAIVETLEGKIESKEDSSLTINMTQTNLESVTMLALDSKEIEKINGLEKFTNAFFITLAINNISDISILSNLTNLSNLNLSRNNISNISALSGLTNLTSLTLFTNNISDISVLSRLTNLTDLSLSDNNISDVSTLSKLTNLEELDLGHNNISNISALSQLTNLSDLKLNYNNINDINALSTLKSLKSLDLNNNNINNISVLSGLTNLSDLLYVSYNSISDISALSKLTNLKVLFLDGNNISEINSLSELTNLESLGLAFNDINDISTLSSLTNLTYLDLKYNNISDISALSNLPNLSVVVTYQSLSTTSSEKEVELPPIFLQSQDKNSKVYTEEEVSLEKCTLNEEKDKVIIEEGSTGATVTINGGNANGTCLNITSKATTPLLLEVSYSTTKLTNGNVEAKITANKEIQEVEGWTLAEDKTTLTKTYEENANETVTVYDVEGNSAEAKIDIKNIDKTAPETEVTYSTTELTKENVEVTITANERIQEVEGWSLSEDGTTLTKTYTENGEETLEIYDIAGNKVDVDVSVQNIEKAEIELALEIKYSTTKLTNKDVEVEVIANKEIQELEGWTLSEDKKTLSKTYSENGEEEITIYDLTGNSAKAKIEVKNIDKITPEIDIKYSTKESTNEEVLVTIQANEIVQEMEGWTLSEDGKTLTKAYEKNAEEIITIYDLAGNSTTVTIKVDNITDGNDTIKKDDNTIASSILPYAGKSSLMIVVIAIVALVAIILKRKVDEYKDIK